MKIAVIVSHFPQITETFILNRITGLLDHGHEVSIFAYEPGPSRVIHPDIRRYSLDKRTTYFNIPSNRIWRVLKAAFLFLKLFPRHARFLSKALNIRAYGCEAASLRLFFGTLAFLDKGPFCIIYSCHGPNGLKDTWLREIGVLIGKHVISFHGADATRHVQIHGWDVYERLFKKGDLILPVSDGMKEVLRRLGCPEHKLKTHHTGVDLSRFVFRQTTFVPGQTLKLVSVGRLVEKKGFEYAIQAVTKLVRDGFHVSYEIAGDGELKDDLARLIRENSMENYIRLLGDKDQDEVIQFLKQGHILLQPSVTAGDGNKEGIPNAIKEAMAVGLPVIATRHGEIPELIRDGVTGRLVDEKDVLGIYGNIRDFFQWSDEWRYLPLNARQKIEADFDIAKLNEELIQTFEELMRTPVSV